MKISRKKPKRWQEAEWRTTVFRSKTCVSRAKYGEIVFELRNGWECGYVADDGRIWMFDEYFGDDKCWPFKQVRRWAYRVWTGETRRQAFIDAQTARGEI